MEFTGPQEEEEAGREEAAEGDPRYVPPEALAGPADAITDRAPERIADNKDGLRHTGHTKSLSGPQGVRSKFSEVGPEPDEVEVKQGVVEGGETHDP